MRLRNVGPFEDAALRFTLPEQLVEAEGPTTESESDITELETVASETPRPLTVLFGGDGTGKTSILNALAVTRPGHALPPIPPAGAPRAEGPSWVATDWLLGEDDPERPHPLVVASPSAVLQGETPDTASVRRREQAHFDRRAQNEGGHVFVSFSGARWFSRVPNMLTVPERTILRYDIRQPNASFDDPTRADLTRDTKQIISYASVGAALGAGRAEFDHLARFEEALREVIDVVLEPFDLVHAGVSPTSLEPQARSRATGAIVPFDAIPRAARHRRLRRHPLRALAAYPGADAPRERARASSPSTTPRASKIPRSSASSRLLRRALPNVQWILTTSSTQLALACDASEIGWCPPPHRSE
ncbi:MAG: hypothetical protein U0270_33770 [Labilithrix sp.]